MSDTSSLLKDLKLDRDQRQERRRPWLSVVFVCAAIIFSLAVYLTSSDSGGVTPAAVPTAIPLPSSETQNDILAAAPNENSSVSASILDSAGYVVARRKATVSSKITGKVVGIFIEEGQHVSAGQIIARLEDTNMQAAFAKTSAELELARARSRAALISAESERRMFSRIQSQYQKSILSPQDMDSAKLKLDSALARVDIAKHEEDVAVAALEIARQALEDTIVRAPFDGIITAKAAQEGEMISPVSAGGGFTRTGIGTIVDMDSLEIEVDINEGFIQKVHAGQKVSIGLNAYPDSVIEGHVIAIVPAADRATATILVRISLDRKDERVLPEMGVRVSFF